MAEVFSGRGQVEGEQPASGKESSDSGWNIQSIFEGVGYTSNLEAGIKAGAKAASSDAGKSFLQDINVCNPQKWSDYLIGASIAGIAFVGCSAKAVNQQLENNTRKPN